MSGNVFFSKLKRYKNKILAILFSGLALALFAAFYLLYEINYDWTFFRRNPGELWNFFCLLVPFLIIFICNIRNDNYAYNGIMMFVLLEAFSSTMNAVQMIIYGYFLTLAIIQIVFVAATAVIGFLLYIRIVRYMRGFDDDFKKVRVFAIIYTSLLLTSLIFYCVIMYNYLAGDLLLLFAAYGLSLAEACEAVAVIFTLERLRRI